MITKKVKIITDVILVAIITFLFALGFLTENAVTISSSSGDTAIYFGSSDSGGVAITFNVYENGDIVLDIIKTLKKHGAKATFYVGGCWADDNAPILLEIIEAGFELGNHGYFHKDHKKLSFDDNVKEIDNCHKIVKSLTGYEMNLFAPPSGAYSQTTLNASESLNYKTIMWSKDVIDWRDSDIEIIHKRATENVKSGDIILMHPKPHTLIALDGIIEAIKLNGLELLTVSQCIKN